MVKKKRTKQSRFAKIESRALRWTDSYKRTHFLHKKAVRSPANGLFLTLRFKIFPACGRERDVLVRLFHDRLK